MLIKDKVKLNLASKNLKISDFWLKVAEMATNMSRKKTNKAAQIINECKTRIGA